LSAGSVREVVLDVVIVSHRCRELLRCCLDSLLAHTPASGLRIVVVDNASGDGTVELVREDFPQVDLVDAGRNLGFAAASNRGIRRGDAVYVLALNPDTRLTAGALDGLLELMAAHPEVGVCGPKLVREDGSLDHAAKRSFPTPFGALAHFAGSERSQYRAPDVESGPVDAVSGAFMLMRRAALDEVGLFDEGYWMYMEDLDLCYRFQQAGWTTWYEPSVTVVHVKHGSAGPRRNARLELAFHYGMHRFCRKHRGGRPLLERLAVYAAIWTRCLVAVGASLGRRLAPGH
jgi:GT2 family glycosyltransferase